MKYGTVIELERSFDDTVSAVRAALAEQGFGVLTEIDVQSTLRAKLGEEIEDYLILGACNPVLAHQALSAEPSLGLLLPCNVVVRAGREGRTVVEAMDPNVMVMVTDNPVLAEVAHEAARRLDAALETLEMPAGTSTDAIHSTEGDTR